MPTRNLTGSARAIPIAKPTANEPKSNKVAARRTVATILFNARSSFLRRRVKAIPDSNLLATEQNNDGVQTHCSLNSRLCGSHVNWRGMVCNAVEVHLIAVVQNRSSVQRTE